MLSWMGGFGRDGLTGSDHADKAVLGLCIAFNVPLGRLDGTVTCKLLDVPQRAPSLRY